MAKIIMMGDRILNVTTDEHAEASREVLQDIYKKEKVEIKDLWDVIDTKDDLLTQVESLVNMLSIPINDIYQDDSGICIDVLFGDWKHVHAWLDQVMSAAFNLKLHDEIITEEDGSDAYASIHIYEKA